MARPGWFDENRTRAYPFLMDTVGLPIVGSPTLRNLPLDAVVDAGFIAGPSSGYQSAGDYVYLNRVWRAANRFYFEFLSTAVGLLNKAMVFSRNLSADEFVTTLEDLSSVEAEDSVSVSNSPCDEKLEWSGFLTTGSMDKLATLMADGDTWLNPGNSTRLEPGTVQNLSNLVVQNVSLANADRTTPNEGEECGATQDYDPGMIRPWAECLVGRLLFKPGYNISIEQSTANNAITFRPAVGEGDGEPCGEVPTYPEEGEEGDDLSGALRCREVLRSINGQGGSVFSIEANAGFSLVADPKNNRLVIDANFVNMEACIDGVSQSVFVPEPDVPDETTTTTTTSTTPAPAALWTPMLSPYPLGAWLTGQQIDNEYPSGGTMTNGWSDETSFTNRAVAHTQQPTAVQNVLNGYTVASRTGSQGLKFNNLLAAGGGTLSTFWLLRLSGATDEEKVALFDTPNRQFSLFSPSPRVSAGGVSQDAGVILQDGEWAIVQLEIVAPNGTFSVRINGNLAASGTAGWGFFDAIFWGVSPSGDGVTSGVTQYAEQASYFAPLPTSERQKQEGYWAHKFGMTSVLPPSHPYRFTPPRV